MNIMSQEIGLTESAKTSASNIHGVLAVVENQV